MHKTDSFTGMGRLLFLAAILFVITAKADAQTPAWLWSVNNTLNPGIVRSNAVDPAGNSYIIRTASASVNVAKYSPSGSMIWITAFQLSGTATEWNIIADDKGNCLVAGDFSGKAEDMDPFRKFSISRQVAGRTATTPFTKDLSGFEGDNLSYDYTTVREPATTKDQVEMYTFSVTNRDDLAGQTGPKVTVQ